MMTTALPGKPRPTCKHGESDRAWSNLLVPPGVDVEHLRRLVPHDLPAPLPPIVIRPEEFCLKKLNNHMALTRETNAFDAEVWFRKKLVGRARNDGGGGDTIIDPIVRGSLDEVTAWAAALPPESCYQHIYEDMVDGWGSSDMTAGDWWGDHRCVTYSRDIYSLIGAFVERAAQRKGTRHLNAHMILGPPKLQPHKHPTLVCYKKTITPATMAHALNLHLWACPLKEVFDLPFHYYPAPHPFYGLGWPTLRVVVGDRRGEVVCRGTNDHQVAVRFDDDPAATLEVEPRQARFLTDEEEESIAEELLRIQHEHEFVERLRDEAK